MFRDRRASRTLRPYSRRSAGAQKSVARPRLAAPQCRCGAAIVLAHGQRQPVRSPRSSLRSSQMECHRQRVPRRSHRLVAFRLAVPPAYSPHSVRVGHSAFSIGVLSDMSTVRADGQRDKPTDRRVIHTCSENSLATARPADWFLLRLETGHAASQNSVLKPSSRLHGDGTSFGKTSYVGRLWPRLG